uniref:substrate-binding domain-containing protein n=1 Tax=Duncaniella muris TaxID=2094150 RepID=UPI0027375C69
MTTNKKLLAMALAGAMLTGMLAGCGGGSGNSANGSSADSDAATDDAYNINVIVKLTDGHFSRIMAGAQAYADEHSNVNIEVMSPPSATPYEEQMNMIETSLGNNKFDAVVISPLQSSTASSLVSKTNKTIIALDTDFESDKKSAFVGTGNHVATKSGGQA